MIIYKTTNLINGKIYVGQDSHNDFNYLGSGKILKQAINKYGRQNFQKETLCECKTKEELNEKEIYWIKKLHSQNGNIGYNIMPGGNGGNLGEKWKEKISVSIKKIYFNKPELKEKLSKLKKKYYKEHPELKTQLSQIKKEYFKKPENHPWFGKNRDQNTIDKIKKGNIKYWTNPENKTKMIKNVKKTLSKPEIKKKISEKTSKKIYKYDKEWNLLDEYYSIKEAGKQNNLHPTTIGHSCKQKTIRGGFHWSFDKK